ncbi:MAG: response regulator [Candidatus Hydrogenedentes bacterium]|nr:response regulator [Candidatus Hydrogenedentota bacterium]
MARVLIIDDDYAMRQAIREILEDAGHEIVEAPNGLSGIEMQRKHHVDLVISDIFMPEKEGMSTIRDLCGEFPGLRTIAMSGGNDDLSTPGGFIELARRFGARATITKPFKVEEFLAVVNQVLCEE